MFSADLRKRMLAELFGTFALVFAGTGAIAIDAMTETVTHVGIALTFGFVVMAMIYAIGDVSGAHINPAVTIGFVLARRLEPRFALPYVASQVVGAVAASFLLAAILGGTSSGMGVTLPSGTAWQSFWLEIVLTWILMLVILRVSVGARETGIMAGAAIGAVIAFEALFAGPISGASMNPARSLGPALVSGQLDALWVYLVAPVLGAGCAVPFCRWLQTEECCGPSTC